MQVGDLNALKKPKGGGAHNKTGGDNRMARKIDVKEQKATWQTQLWKNSKPS